MTTARSGDTNERSRGEGDTRRDGGGLNPLPLVGMFMIWLLIAVAVPLALSQSTGPRAYLLATDFRTLYTGGRMVLGGG